MQSATRFSSPVRAAAVETLERRQLFATIPLGELGLGHRADYATPNGSTSYKFSLDAPATVDVALSFGTANITRNRVVVASGNDFSRPLPAGDYSIEVSTRGGSSLLVKTSNFSPPTRLEADVWGGNAIRLNWDDNTDTEAYYRIDRWTRLGWRRGQYVPADYTAAVMNNLIPGYATTYRVSAVTAEGESLRSANTVTALTLNEDTSGWYKVNLTERMTRGHAGWIKENRNDPGSQDYRGEADTLKVWPGYQLSGSETQSDWVYTSSWQDAVYTAIGSYNIFNDDVVTDSSKVRVTFDGGGYQVNDTVYHNFPSSGDFKIGTGAELAANPSVENFKLDDSENVKYIALEDSYNGIDRDYDDFFWEVETEFKPNVAVSTLAHGSEGGANVQFGFHRFGPTDGPLSVQINWTGSSASGDFVSRPTTVNFSIGQSDAVLTLPVKDDSDAEWTETVVANLAENSAYGFVNDGSNKAKADISDNDLAISLNEDRLIVNNDDSDDDGVIDLEDTDGVSGEDGLYAVQLKYPHSANGEIKLSWPTDKVKIWKNQNRTSEITYPAGGGYAILPVGSGALSQIFVEAIAGSAMLGDVVLQLQAVDQPPSSQPGDATPAQPQTQPTATQPATNEAIETIIDLDLDEPRNHPWKLAATSDPDNLAGETSTSAVVTPLEPVNGQPRLKLRVRMEIKIDPGVPDAARRGVYGHEQIAHVQKVNEEIVKLKDALRGQRVTRDQLLEKVGLIVQRAIDHELEIGATEHREPIDGLFPAPEQP